MSKPVLKLGSKGQAVKDLVKRLKKEFPANLDLDPTFDEFDSFVETAVIDLQKKLHLQKDGVVGKCTWNALDGKEEFCHYTETSPYHDSTSAHCWKVATYFLLQGKSGPASPYFVTAGAAKTEYDLIGMGGIENSHANVQLFADHWHLTLLRQPSMTPRKLAGMVKSYGRVMLNAKGKDGNSHFICVNGVRGDGTESGTSVAVMDPLEGEDFQPDALSYAGWMYRNPGFFYQVLYR